MSSSGDTGNIITLPRGGGALSGLGEKFSPDLFTGTGNFSVPVALPLGRNGIQPQLTLMYSTGHGNGCFGLGWNLGIPNVSRKTSKGVPRYRDSSPNPGNHDVFILSGAEDLVPLSPAPATQTRYRPRTEGLFASIEHQVDAFTDVWQVKTTDGLISIYGTPNAVGHDPAVVADPDVAGQGHIAQWFLTSTVDPFGNRIEYEYLRSGGIAGQRHWDQLYVTQIRYADYDRGDATGFLVSVDFSYEEDRPDAFSDYRNGFEIRTTKRCSGIAVTTHADQDRLARTYRFTYLDQRPELSASLPANGASLLNEITVTGFDGADTETLPPLTFAYTPFDPTRRQFSAITGSALPPTSLASPDLDLVDLFGNGLPDLLQISGNVRYWRNLGNGAFSFPQFMSTAPAGVSLADPGVQLLDANGNGRADLMVSTPLQSGFYPLTFDGVWEAGGFRSYPVAPTFNLKDPEVKMLDLTGDGVTDAVRSGTTQLECFFNDPVQGWHETRTVARSTLDAFPGSFADPHVAWGDISGDGLQDVLVIHDGSVDYWPNLGYGNWGKRTPMVNSPSLPFGYDPHRILVGDVDGDGLADIVYVDNGSVTVWINSSGNRWSDPIAVVGTPMVSNLDSILLTDVDGAGVSGVLWSKSFGGPGESPLSFLDLTGGVKPYLLIEMNNNCGATTKVEYASSVRFYLDDQSSPDTRWRSVLPFPVQVVAAVEVVDAISRGKLTTQYRYHQGYWDGIEREFRGFGLVEQLDTETFTRYGGAGLHGNDVPFAPVEAQHFSPPMLTKTWFHQGAVGDEVADWQEFHGSDGYWPGDPQMLGQANDVNQFLNLIGGTPQARAAQRDALRSLRGSVLRTELFALDGSVRSGAPFTVSEKGYALIEIDPPGVDDSQRRHIYFPHLVAQRTTQWERGNDPLTQFSVTDYRDSTRAFDPFGRPRTITSIACPRGWRDVGDRPVERYLSTRVSTSYADPIFPGTYRHDRVAVTTDYEILNTEAKTVSEIAALGEADADLRLVGQTRTYYDGPAFDGLPVGQIGLFGASTKTEILVLTADVVDQAYGADVPPYLEPTGHPAWTADYPSDFRTRLPSRAGYVFRAGSGEPGDAGGYFAQADRRRYDFQSSVSETGRGLLLEAIDPLHDANRPSGHRTLIAYDQYDLLPRRVTDAAALTTEATYDYRVLQPSEVTDINGNVSVFTFSPLGLLTSSFARGKVVTEGDQLRASVRLEYAFRAFMDSPANHRQPIYTRTTRRVHHDTEVDVSLPEREATISTIEYSDGFGRTVQKRTQGEEVRFGDDHFGGGETLLPRLQPDGPGGDVIGRVNTDPLQPNVVVSGWQTFDNLGRTVERYEPFFAQGWEYDRPAEEDTGQKVVIFYDARGRGIRTVNPDGSEERAIFGVPGTLVAPDLTQPDSFEPTPWEQYIYDANDNAGRTHAAESIGFRHHWDTPASGIVDALGRTVSQVCRYREPAAVAGNPLPPIQELQTRTSYDIHGNVLRLIDTLGRNAFEHVHDLRGRRLLTASIDAGTRTLTFDAAGGIVEQRDSKGALMLHAYDDLNRPQLMWARNRTGGDVTMRHQLEYGDAGDPSQPFLERALNRAANRLGHLVTHRDDAGVESVDRRDFKGNPLEKTRRVISDAALLAAFSGPPPGWDIEAFHVDWTNAGAVPLDPAAYTSNVEYDALNRVKIVKYPEDVEGQRRALMPRYNNSGALESAALEWTDPSGAAHHETVIERIAYNAKRQRVLIAYGNATMTRYAYDPQTFRLVHLRTEGFTKPAPLDCRHFGVPLQVSAYNYDLVGNISTIHERTPGSGIPGSALGPDALDREFTHDPLYRLSSATGRECDEPPAFPWNAGPRSTDLTKTRRYTQDYRYDEVGNLERLTHKHGPTGFTRGFTAADGTNRLLTLGLGVGSDLTYTYDKCGNMTGEAASRHYEWDYADRMTVYRTQAGNSEPSVHAQYLYGANGQRVKKLTRRQGGQVEVTVYADGIFEHKRIIRPGAVAENSTLHVMDHETPIAQVRIGTPFADDVMPAVIYHLHDHLGSSNVVTDELGSFISREEYTPFGETSFGSFARKRYRFTGKERDEESGLSYHGARYYAPWLARWTSCDPAGAADGANLYAYVRNNPLRLKDSSGTQSHIQSSAGGPEPAPTTNAESPADSSGGPAQASSPQDYGRVEKPEPQVDTLTPAPAASPAAASKPTRSLAQRVVTAPGDMLATITGLIWPQYVAPSMHVRGATDLPAGLAAMAELTGRGAQGSLYLHSDLTAVGAAGIGAGLAAPVVGPALTPTVPNGALAGKGVSALAAAMYVNGGLYATEITGATTGVGSIGVVASSKKLLDVGARNAPRYAQVAADLENNPALVTTLKEPMSDGYLWAALRNPGVARMVFGKAWERLSVQATSGVVMSNQPGAHPDAIVKVGNQLVKIDWTMAAGLASHLDRSYYQVGPFIIYLHTAAPKGWP